MNSRIAIRTTRGWAGGLRHRLSVGWNWANTDGVTTATTGLPFGRPHVFITDDKLRMFVT